MQYLILLAHNDVHVHQSWETIESFKEVKGRKVVACSNTLKPNYAWTKYFWAYFLI
jgi:hypothetical protein